jgi:hypothetical protein
MHKKASTASKREKVKERERERETFEKGIEQQKKWYDKHTLLP